MPPAERQIDLQGERVVYRLVRSHRARQLRIDAGLQGIKLVVPDDVTVDPDAVIAEHAAWILKQRDKYAHYRKAMPTRRFEEGESFPVFGTPRTLEVKPMLRSRITDEAFQLARRRVEQTSIRDELEHLYRQKARRHFTARADHYCDVMGVKYEKLQVRNQKTRWGSYSSRTGTLSLNWRLMMAPPEVIDYAIVHELAHAEVPSHGKRFWRVVAQHLPDFEEKDTWLKENSTALVFAGGDL